MVSTSGKYQKKLIITTILIITSLVFSGLVRSAVQTGASVSSYGTVNYSVQNSLLWIHTEGKNFVDEEGNIVYLRGCNYDDLEWAKSLTPYKEDLQQMKGWGFNIIRLPFSWEFLEHTRGTYDSSYMAKLEQIVAWGKELGIYVLLDFHQLNWNTGQGIPSWVGTSSNFISNTNGVLDSYFNMWGYVASYFTDEPAVIGYDLMNEPVFFNTADINTFSIGAANEIRAVEGHDKHIIFFEGGGGYGDVRGGIGDMSNTACANHGYYLYGKVPYTGRSMTYDVGGGHVINMETYTLEHMAAARNIPALHGEFGWGIDWQSSTDSVELYVRDMWDIIDEYGMSGTWWQYPMTRGTFNQGMSLVFYQSRQEQARFFTSGMDRPYVQKTSIKPDNTQYTYPSWNPAPTRWERKTFYSFDLDTKNFTFKTLPGTGNQHTEIYVPARFYPDGFNATINATIQSYEWDPNNRILTIDFTLTSSAIIVLIPDQGIIVGSS